MTIATILILFCVFMVMLSSGYEKQRKHNQIKKEDREQAVKLMRKEWSEKTGQPPSDMPLPLFYLFRSYLFGTHFSLASFVMVAGLIFFIYVLIQGGN